MADRPLTGKTTFFVANQDSIDAVPSDKLAALEADCGALEDANKALAAQLKTLSAGACVRACVHACVRAHTPTFER